MKNMKQKFLVGGIIILTLFFVIGYFQNTAAIVQGQPRGEAELCPAPGQGNCPPGQCKVGEDSQGIDLCQLRNPAPGQLVGTSNVDDLVTKLVNILLSFAGAIAVIFLVIGGFRYVVSQGNEEAMERAKKTLLSAIIGIVVIIMAFAVVNIVNNLLTKEPGATSGRTPNPNPNPQGNNINITVTGFKSSFQLGDLVLMVFSGLPAGNYNWSVTGTLPKGINVTTNPPGLSGFIATDSQIGLFSLRVNASGDGKNGTHSFSILVQEQALTSP